MRSKIRTAAVTGVVAFAAVTSFVNGAPGAVAESGDPVILGAANTATWGTVIENTSSYVAHCDSTDNSKTGLEVCGGNWGLIARGGGGVLAESDGPGYGVLGYGGSGLAGVGRAALGAGVTGEGYTGIDGTGDAYGVKGHGRDPGSTGVFGSHVGNTGIGVHGRTGGVGSGIYGEATAKGVGVSGSSVGGTGVAGSNSGYEGIGVYGKTGGVGSGVYGENLDTGVGVYGESSLGTGVLARSSVGTALDVRGRARFSRSGLAVVNGTKSDPKSRVVVDGVALAAASMVLATPQRSHPGVFVQGAVPNVAKSTVTIILNKPVTGRYPVAWFVLERPA